MGSRGLSSSFKGGNYDRRKINGWNIDKDNATYYGIDLTFKKSLKYDSEMVKGRLNDALGTINKMGELLGLKPDNMPKVQMYYGKYSSSSYGDCIISLTDGYYDAKINLYGDMFKYRNYDTAAHEMVHGIEAWYIRTMLGGPETFERQDWMKMSDATVMWAQHSFDDAICRQALVSIGKQSPTVAELDMSAWKTAADTIKLHKYDTYASSQPCETITRAVQIVLRQGSSAPEYAHAIVNELRKEVKNIYAQQKKNKKGRKI